MRPVVRGVEGLGRDVIRPLVHQRPPLCGMRGAGRFSLATVYISRELKSLIYIQGFFADFF